MDMTSYINVKTNQTLKSFKVWLKIYVKYRAHAKKIVIARGQVVIASFVDSDCPIALN